MLETILEITLAALLGAGAPAGGPAVDGPDTTEQEAEEAELEEEELNGGPPKFARIALLIQLNVEAAQARAAAAMGHAEDVRGWTACIAAAAANLDNLPRDDSFDPKAGCTDLRPEFTPDGLPFGGDDGPDDENAGPPSWAGGPPEGAGPPSGVSGGDDDEAENEDE